MQRELAEEEERRKTIEIPLPPSSQTQSCSSAWGGENKKFDTLKRKATDINNQLASGGSGGSEVVVVPHRQHEGLFIVNTQLCTKNFIPGEAVADETLFRVSNEDGSVVEYRVWDPSRSKLEAVILVGLDYFSVKPGVKVLYLGADSFATVSHLSDIVGTSGMVYAVTSSPCKELSDMAIKRTYVRLINEDPSNPSKYRELVGNVDVMLSEIPLDCQVQMMAVNASYFLKVGGHFVVSFQAKHLKFGLPFTSREVICVGFMRLVGARLEPYQEVYIERHVAYYVGAYKGRAEVGSHTMDKQKLLRSKLGNVCAWNSVEEDPEFDIFLCSVKLLCLHSSYQHNQIASHEMLSKIACKRLQKESVEQHLKSPSRFKHNVTNNLEKRKFRSSCQTITGSVHTLWRCQELITYHYLKSKMYQVLAVYEVDS
ncbi:hypothetical protein POM88_009962 [Heracleum sosnowskyi]|uniref:Uncharacterized protein n=1 Tax=Heracleum sosnowskyi TaxID=360622 RepID=A0AAD8N7W5_9APIA|nr:hypothetical protein POM88_009962 [Heracleum sosnowskyi]